MITRIRLDPGQIVRVMGPARARVVSGQVLVLGAIFNPGDEFAISKYRSYAIKGLVETSIEIVLDAGGSIEKPLPGEEVIDKWVSEIDSLIQKGCRRIIVVGPVDSGKTSVVALASNRSLLRGFRVGVIDADVGQADIGPPASVSASVVSKQILWLRELEADHIRFIGSITPQRNERRIVAAVVDLVSRLERKGVDTIIVDTDGWIQGINSIEYKAEMARFINADAVIIVGDDFLYQSVKQIFSGLPCRAVFLESPKIRRERSRDERRALRSEAYRRYLTPLYERLVDLSSVSIYGSCFFSGRRVRGREEEFQKMLRVRVLGVSETSDTYYVVTEGQPPAQAIGAAIERLEKQVYVLDKNIARGALLSIIGSDYQEKALGILKDFDLGKSVAIIATPYTGKIKGIIFGSIRLGEDFEELGKPLRCVI